MRRRRRSRSIWRDNGLSITLAVLFLVFWAGQSLTGWQVFNAEQVAHGEPALGFLAYLRDAHFAEATFENWESEFLQMATYVVLTAFLFQRGSAESNDPDDAEPPAPVGRDAPWAVRRGGWVRALYGCSLSIAFVLLFAASFLLHAVSGAARYNAEQLAHGQPGLSVARYLATAQFWFESFQNWQSEFLAILAMVTLSIFLRQQGSAESKDIAAPHHQTGA
ncbi:MAG: DUF6766 family protein [Deltaproteobacteria bacterium]|nr:DUF6766 family protein [Deltaproteobacteria bacterium]